MNSLRKKSLKNKRKHLSEIRGNRVFVLCLSFVLLLGLSQPAHASCFIDGVWICLPTFVDPKEDAAIAAGWAQRAKEFIQQQAQWVTENYADATDKAANIASQQLQAQVNITGTQAKVDGARVAVNAGGVADINVSMHMNRSSQVCSLHRTYQAAGRAQAAAEAALELLEALSTKAGTGLRADVNSPAYYATEVDDLCRLGFLDMRPGAQYAADGQKWNCKDLSDSSEHIKLINKHKYPTSVLSKLQYPLPNMNNVHATQDGHLSFVSANDPNQMASPDEVVPGLGSEMDFVAAYKYCMHFAPVRSAAAQSTANSTGVIDVASVWGDSANSAAAVAKDECLHALTYRMSCPKSVAGQLADTTNPSGLDCYAAQQQLCDRLTAGQPSGGVGLSLANDDPLFATALQNCDEQGISQAMYDAIMARKCNDDSFTLSMANTLGSAADLEKAKSTDCSELREAYENRMIKERKRLMEAVNAVNTSNH